MASMLTITIPEELRAKLKKEANQSALITHLLNKHYSTDTEKMEDLSLEELKKREQQIVIKKESGKLDVELASLRELMKERNQTAEEKKQEEENKKKAMIDAYKDTLKTLYEVDDDEVDSLAEMFKIERDLYPDLLSWGAAKGLKKRK